MKMIKLKCENCGANLEVNSEQDKIFCQYCGAKVLIDDAATELRRVEDVKLEARKKNHEETIKEKQELDDLAEKEKFKKGKLSKVAIAFVIICLLFTFTAFRDGKIISGIIGVIQVACFSVGWLSGMQIIKEKFKSMHMVLIIIGFVLIVPFFGVPNDFGGTSYDYSTKCENIDWKRINLKEYLADYDKPVGELSVNSDESFIVTLCNVSKDKYKDYVNKTRDLGYTVDSAEYGESFFASSNKGYTITITWKEEKEMYISLSKNTDNESNIKDKENTKKEEKENTKKQETTTNTNGLRSDFKKAMDEYEKYMDEYIAFMNKFNSNPSDYELIMQYAKVVKQYKETEDSFEKWKEEDLTEEEEKYYLEVQTRVNQKLNAAALDE